MQDTPKTLRPQTLVKLDIELSSPAYKNSLLAVEAVVGGLKCEGTVYFLTDIMALISASVFPRVLL